MTTFSDRLTAKLAAVLLLCAAGSSAHELTPTNFSNQNVSEIPIRFANWCWEGNCAFRTFAHIGGYDVLIDTGCDILAFCDGPKEHYYHSKGPLLYTPPNGTTSTPVYQCTTYGGGSHGWYGTSYSGTVLGPWGSHLADITWSNMKATVGLEINQCGGYTAGSRGMDQVSRLNILLFFKSVHHFFNAIFFLFLLFFLTEHWRHLGNFIQQLFWLLFFSTTNGTLHRRMG